MTPHLWHTVTPWITRHHRRLSRVAAGLLLLAGVTLAGVALAELPDRLFLVAFSSGSAAFALLCLGLIEKWFKEPPPSISEKPGQFLLLWYGALFYNVYLLACLAFFGLGIFGLIFSNW